MHFEILGEIEDQETFASGHGIRELARLQKYTVKVSGDNVRDLLTLN